MQGPHVHVDGYTLRNRVAPHELKVWAVDTAHRHVTGDGVSEIKAGEGEGETASYKRMAETK